MITVFTSTYNRAYMLTKLYESLLNQTCKDFEWIIVNDGSTDDTGLLISDWARDNERFKIVSVNTENGGKHRAINIGLKIARGDCFYVVDSDDRLPPDSLEMVSNWMEGVNNNNALAGVVGLKGRSVNTPLNGYGLFDNEYLDADINSALNYGLKGDMAQVYKTDILRQYFFPEFEGENFITEVYHIRISIDGYKMRWYNRVIYLCDYYEDGLTSQGIYKFLRNPQGTKYSLNIINEFYSVDYMKRRRLYYWIYFKDEYGYEKSVDYICNGNRLLAEELEENKELMINKMNEYFVTNKIRTAAIYGLGTVGDLFLKIRDRLYLKNIIGIDKKEKSNIEIETVKYDTVDYIEADIVVITLAYRNTALEKELKKKCNNVVSWSVLSNEFWMW